ncbi:MAG: Rrf2 family transcriptional regulator [Chloroflexi bacterium]|jgi:Rrf2 family transcriptional regulator, cysteine metabolism repressor|nr:Rrf2 family transcriptional regulator [Chloroflexota bacterium]
MKISTKGRYGTRALLDVALRQNEGLVQLKDIAESQQISLHYLERIVALLVKKGFLTSTRGPAGGVALGRHPADIKISEVISVLEGSMAPVSCVDDPSTCSRAGFCATCDLWGEVKESMEGVLEAVTLQDLVERQQKKLESQPRINTHE